MMEICIDSIESARNAYRAGAHRLEVCSALSEGGLTPTIGFFELVKRTCKIPLYVMIRIRAGDFNYSQEEMDAMIVDADNFIKSGANGLVFGALKKDHSINQEYCNKIINCARSYPVTFHRAFDLVINPLESLEILIEMGFKRILTSGQMSSAVEGVSLIRELIERAGKRIIIMPGAGITVDNLELIIEKTGAQEYHASCKKLKVQKSIIDKFKNNNGVYSDVMITDERIVENFIKILYHKK